MRLTTAASIIAKIVAAGMLFGALARNPYDYYTLLRWVVCCVAAFGAVRAADTQQSAWVWPFAGVALLFNPVIPIHLRRDTWALIDVSVAILLLISIPFTDRFRSPP